jgi:hypothetical protein
MARLFHSRMLGLSKLLVQRQECGILGIAEQQYESKR